MQFNTLAILGVGLIGGSVALAARARRLVRRVIGFEPDEPSQARSLALGLVDEMATAPNSSCIASADMVICCAPVDRVYPRIEPKRCIEPFLLLLDQIGLIDMGRSDGQ